MAGSTAVRRGVVRCGLAAVLFGATAPASSRLATDMDAFALAGLLYLGAGIAVLPVLVGSRRSVPTADEPGVSRSAWLRLAVAVAAGGAVGPVLLAAGLARLPAASASLLLNLELVFTALIAGVFFGEQLGRRVLGGAAAVLLGSVVLGWQGAPELRFGAALVAGACACWALDNCVTAALDRFRPAQITFAKGVVAGSANAAIGLARAHPPTMGQVGAALAIGTVGYGASISAWVSGARELGAARGQLVFATAPFIGAAVAWVALGDAVGAAEVFAVVAGAAGVSLVLRSTHEHDHIHDSIDHDHAHAHDEHHRHEHATPVQGVHAHRHRHEPQVHRHPHVPDLHHRHEH